MAKDKETRGGKRNGAGRPSEGKTARVSFSCLPDLASQLDSAAKQTKLSKSAIVVAGLRAILSQSPDRLKDAVAGR